jgi:hypothetical protein
VALIPKLRMRFEDVDKDKILTELAKQSKKAQETDQPPQVRRVGVTKEQYYQSFDLASRLGLKFDVLLVLSSWLERRHRESDRRHNSP